MKDVKLNNNIKCCSSEQVEFGNTARDIILYKKIKELAIVVENKQDKFDFIKLIHPSGNLGRDIVGKLFTNKLIELEYNGCFYSFSKADESTLVYQALTADLNLLKIVTINITTGDYLVIEQSNEVLDEHIADQVIHVSQADRDRWNNINDGILTIQTNGTNVQTFSANQSSNATANIIVPTKTSDLTNDSNFVISSDLAVFATKEYVDGSVASAISRVYKPQGTVTVDILNNLTITKEMNGYVYDISGTGTLTKGSVQVTQGDNVAIIWNEDETDWKWDRLSSIVDLSNYATKTYVNQGLNSKVNHSNTTSGEYIYGIADGVDKVYPIQKQAISDSIVQRTGNANIVVPLTPAANDCATSKQYVDTYSGKIDSISLNGATLAINSNKNVDIPVSLTTTAGSESVTINSNSLDIVTRDTDQTITGIKTFKDEIDLQYPNGNTTWKIKAAGDYSFFIQRDDNIWFDLITTQGLGLDYTFYPMNLGKDLGKSASPWNDLYLSGKCCTNDIDSSDNMFFGKTGYTQYARGILASASNGLYDLGKLSNKWKDLYLSGNISDGTNSVSVADITSSTFNVINASDIVNNTLTQEQYDLITNGKPTLIKGVFLSGYTNFVLFPPLERSVDFIFEAHYTTGYPAFVLGLVSLNKATKVISLNTNRFYRGEQFESIATNKFNSKDVPAYPSSTGTFSFKYANGALTWTEEWYGTQAEYDALGTYDNNTIYNIVEE